MVCLLYSLLFISSTILWSSSFMGKSSILSWLYFGGWISLWGGLHLWGGLFFFFFFGGGGAFCNLEVVFIFGVILSVEIVFILLCTKNQIVYTNLISMTQMFRFKNRIFFNFGLSNCWPNKFLDQTNFDLDFFGWITNFWIQKSTSNFLPKILLAQKIYVKLIGTKQFWPKHCGAWNFVDHLFFGS